MDSAYIAGLFDGEGSIGLYITKGCKDSRYKRGYRRPTFVRVISIGSCYLPVLKRVRDHFGCGQVNPHRRRHPAGNKQMYYWCVGAKAEITQVLVELLPLLKEKHAQAEIMLAAIRGEIAEGKALLLLKKLKVRSF